MLRVKKILRILVLKFLEQRITDYLCSQNIVCKNKKSRFVKEQDTEGLLSNLGIKTPLIKIPLLNVLFQV